MPDKTKKKNTTTSKQKPVNVYYPKIDKGIGDTDKIDFINTLNFENKYIQSKKFKERVEKAGYDYPSYKQDQQRKLKTISLKVDDTDNNRNGAYYSSKNKIAVWSDKNRMLGSGDIEPVGTDTFAHEVGHSFDNDRLNDYIYARNILTPKTIAGKIEEQIKQTDEVYNAGEGHEKSNYEVSADVHSARYELYQYGLQNKKGKNIYDGRYSNFTNDAYNDMVKIARNPNTASYRLLNKIGKKPSDEDMYWLKKASNSEKEEQFLDKKQEELEKKKKLNNKKYLFDIMNNIVDNTKDTNTVTYAKYGGKLNNNPMKYAQPLEKYACGGKMRPSSRKRHIAPALIAAGVQVLGSLFSMGQARKAQKEQEKQLKQQEIDSINAQYSQSRINDYRTYNNTNTFGDNNVEYYANGGEVEDNSLPNSAPKLSPIQLAQIQKSFTQNGGIAPQMPLSNGGYQTKGGNLVPIGEGVEEAVGNYHNQENIDGVSGIQLSKNGEPVAEIENKEVVVDGDTVYSHRLKYDGKQSYADKMRKITAKRNKLEKEQDTTKDKRVKNTIERKLAGLNMAEEALFTHQEHRKYAEGIKVANTFAFGGKLPKLATGGAFEPLPVPDWKKRFLLTEKEGKYKGWYKNAMGQYQHPTNKNIIVDKNGNPMYKFNTSTSSNNKIDFPTTAELNAKDVNWNQTKVQPTASKMLDVDKNGIPDLIQAPSNTTTTTASTVTTPATSTTPTASTAAKGIGSGLGDAALQLAPMLIDNIGNFLLTKNTPKLPAPLLNKAEPLETKVNVNPQLAEIRRTNKALKDNILFNTSNSNNARNNIVATALAGNRQTNEILGAKENQELGLRNADHQNKQMVANTNVATMNDYKFKEFQRQNDIQTKLSTNLSNLQGDIKDVITSGKIDKQFKANQLANLMDDPLGEKALLYAQNKEFMADPANREYIFNVAKAKQHKPLIDTLKRLYNYSE